MFDRPGIDEDPLKNHSKGAKVGTKIFVGVIILGLILLVILAGPLAWDQTYGSPG